MEATIEGSKRHSRSMLKPVLALLAALGSHGETPAGSRAKARYRRIGDGSEFRRGFYAVRGRRDMCSERNTLELYRLMAGTRDWPV